MKQDSTAASNWKSYLVAAIAFSIILFAIYYQTAWSMVHIWWRSETFAHGFLIFPISAWLIWNRRQLIKAIHPAADYRVLVLVAGAGALWLAGTLVDALVVQQFALIGLLVSGLWCILGSRVAWAISFPLAYLFFAVPVGEDLVPPMMEFTATFTVELIKLTGIPVFREGLYFSLPSGNWSVVEACSGIRYLIASITLGCIYAYLTYQSWTKRGLFILLSIAVPVIANGLRAYIIVMLGHMSDMAIATGVDHIIYGWLFFGLVMLILFWIGSFWRDPEPDAPDLSDRKNQTAEAGNPALPDLSPKVGLVLSVLMVVFWQGVDLFLQSRMPDVPASVLTAPQADTGWQLKTVPAWHWQPLLLGADKRIDQFYVNANTAVQLSVGQYVRQRQGQEMVNSQNLLLSLDNDSWRAIGKSSRQITLPAGSLKIQQATLAGEGKQLLVWWWYRIGNDYTASTYKAKILEAVYKLSLNSQGGAKIVVAAPFDNAQEEAAEALQRFVAAHMVRLELALDRVMEKTQ